MATLSDAEIERATESFRREIQALVAEHGREAVINAAALMLPVGLQTLN